MSYCEEDEDIKFLPAFTSDANESQVNQKKSNENLWFFDIGATHHLTNNKNILHNYRTPSTSTSSYIWQPWRKRRHWQREVHLSLNKSKTVSIPNVYYVLGVMRNLLSISKEKMEQVYDSIIILRLFLMNHLLVRC